MMSKLQNELQEQDLMVPMKMYKSGHHFGDYALQKLKPRTSTVICINDCFFAVISAE